MAEEKTKTSKASLKKTTKKAAPKADLGKEVKKESPKTTVKTAPKKTEKTSGGIAVIETGAKQFVVKEGETIKIEKLQGNLKEGDKIIFDKVLLTDNGSATEVGFPYVEKKIVEGKLTEIGRNKKVTIIKFKPKSRYTKKQGHRQPYFKVEITKV